MVVDPSLEMETEFSNFGGEGLEVQIQYVLVSITVPRRVFQVQGQFYLVNFMGNRQVHQVQH
jgi:hypothetical protein